VRNHLEEGKIISVTVPGLKRDMIAYTSKTVPKIAQHADFLNVMTYDLMNRRDPFTKHHSGLNQSLEAIDTYLSLGAEPEKLNLGFAFYARWFKTDHDNCMWDHIGCPTIGLEDPETGADLNNSGVVYWSDPAPANVNGAKVAESFQRALKYGKYEYKGGGYYYWDGSDDLQNIWWTFDTPDAIKRKFPLVVEERGLGGVFAMGIGEDAPNYDHFNAFIRGVEDYVQGGEEETSYGREGKKGGRF
jgi:GH18 family chitinase